MTGTAVRRTVALAGAALVLAGLVGAGPGSPAVPTAAAAGSSGGLTIAGPARYDVRPGQHRVHVVVDLTVTNRTTQTLTTRYVADGFNLAVLPGASGLRAKQGSAAIRAAVVSASSASTLVSVRLAHGLASGASAAVSLSFDLVDRGGSQARAVRVGEAIVGFPVWAYGTPGTGGSSATVRFPAGYRVSVAAGRLGRPVTAADGSTSVASGTLADPWSLSAYLVAERPGAYVESPLSVKVGDRTATFTLRSWKDDRAWTSRTTTLLKRALPALSRALGLAYPGGRIVIEEATPRALDGNGAVYDPSTSTIRLAYSASPAAVLRAVAHLWLPASTFADRWMVEGLAGRATASAAAELKVPSGLPAYGPSVAKAAQPLNAWSADPGRADTARAVETYGYAASSELFRILAARTGSARLRATLQAAADRRPTYPVPTADPTTAGATAGDPGPADTGPVDWRGLLDLVAEQGGVDATDLWREWVVRPEEAALLDVRAAARTHLAALTARAGDWGVPGDIRQAMATWRFDLAEEQMARVGAALDARDRLVVAAAVAGLEPPVKLREAYLRSGPNASIPVIDGARTIVEQITAAQEAGAAASSWSERLGLLGEDPSARLSAARSAWQAGDLETAQTRATEAWATWVGAADAGGLRLRSVLAVLILVVLGLTYLLIRSRARAARREARRDGPR